MRSLSFQATLWYAGLFALLSCTMFASIYVSLVAGLRHRTDEQLAVSAKEFDTLYRVHGLGALHDEFRREAHSRGVRQVFFRLLSAQGEILAASDLRDWPSLETQLPVVKTAIHDQSFETVYPLGHRDGVRVIFLPTTGGKILQLGTSLFGNARLEERYREIFGRALAGVLLCGAILGWVVSRRALSGVERLRQTAIRIGNEDLDLRVPLGQGGQEIDDLSMAFNQMLDRIQKLIQELQDVTNGVAHDLRSPLTRIRGKAEALLISPVELDAFREMAGLVIEECDRVVSILDTTLEIAQTETGLAPLARQPVDLSHILDQAVELFLPMAENKSLSLEVLGSPIALEVMGDKGRLQRVVANVLDNAIKYTPEGGTVQVEAAKKASQVILIFRDTGIGIRPEELDRIFERFYRTDRSRSAPGNGLGLALARTIVEAHGGKISVSSKIGLGSTFMIRLPAATPSRV